MYVIVYKCQRCNVALQAKSLSQNPYVYELMARRAMLWTMRELRPPSFMITLHSVTLLSLLWVPAVHSSYLCYGQRDANAHLVFTSSIIVVTGLWSSHPSALSKVMDLQMSMESTVTFMGLLAVSPQSRAYGYGYGASSGEPSITRLRLRLWGF